MADDSSPALEFVTLLKHGNWREHPEHNPPRDPEQIKDWVMMLAKIEYVGQEGYPDTRTTSVNDLEDGIWEFKHGRCRLTYWDTPGDGTYVPKLRIEDRRTLVGPEKDHDFWWYPRMDAILRLGCAWPKIRAIRPAGRDRKIKNHQRGGLHP